MSKSHSAFGKERERILAEVKEVPAGPEALEKLAIVRQYYDWEIEGYRNTLAFLSDTTYEDRKHFLLELIQNADDAQFTSEEAALTFIIREDSLELRYNEKGFTAEDVIAITGAGVSTKVDKKRLAHSFIGEKGIGFKSVFALATSVEIESPPWHFILHKDKCIVPEVIRSGILKKGEGTRLIVKFSNPDVINIVAKELDRFVAGQVESFLFLQRLGTILVEDRRKDLAVVRGLKLLPPDRSEDKLLLTTFPGDVKRKYVLYREEADFPTELVSGRWERLGYEIGPLKRQIIVAALVDTSGSHYPEGRLFCFLPTSVSLPVPIFLQVDGHTKVDRERLHDPEQNAWNKHLLSLLPGFLLQALLAWRKHEEIAVKLPVYVPVSEGSDQLSFVFKQLIGLLGNAPWVRTFDEEEEGWVSPDKALMTTAYWTVWLTKYPGFRKQVEKILGKKFVHPDWTKDKEIKNKLIFYEVKNMNEVQIATILEKAVLPQEMLKKDEKFIDLYKEILNFPSLTSQAVQSKVWQSIKILREPENTELKKHLLQAPIYPFSGGEFGALQDGDQSAKVFWFSGGARRSTGLEESVDFRIIDVQYTEISTT